jgi:hypothetical protein
MTNEKIIYNALEYDNNKNEQESSTPPNICSIRHDDAMSAFNTCYKWAEENNVQAEDIEDVEKIVRKSSKRGI